MVWHSQSVVTGCPIPSLSDCVFHSQSMWLYFHSQSVSDCVFHSQSVSDCVSHSQSVSGMRQEHYVFTPHHTTPHHSDVLDRKLQAEKSAEILSTTPNPVVMLSYITNPPGSRDYLKIINSGRVKVTMLSLLTLSWGVFDE